MLKPIMSALVASLILSSGAAATAPGPINPLAPKAMLAYTSGSDIGPPFPQAACPTVSAKLQALRMRWGK